jgi:hypothetical protein
MKNQDRLTVRLDAEIRAKLHERASVLGLDDASFVRMLIYGAMNGERAGIRELPIYHSDNGGGRVDGRRVDGAVCSGGGIVGVPAHNLTGAMNAQDHFSGNSNPGGYAGSVPSAGVGIPRAITQAEPLEDFNDSRDEPHENFDEPRAEDFEMPADALDDLLRAGPSTLDAPPQPALQPMARPSAPTYRSAMPQRAAGPQGWGAHGGTYSMTRPVGVNSYAIGTNGTGDGRGNVLRDNMRHFGVAGTRSR